MSTEKTCKITVNGIPIVSTGLWKLNSFNYKEKLMLKLNLGSGFNPINGYINIDNRPECNPDVHCNALYLPYGDNTVDEVRAFDFLEHIPLGSTIQMINTIWDVLKPDGVFEHLTPSTCGDGAFQDPTHVSFWNQNSWLYYCKDSYRNLYNIRAKFVIDELRTIATNEEMNIWHTYGKMRAIK